MLTLSTIALDEAELLAGALESVAGLADRIVLGIDSRTSDQTREVAHAFGADTFEFDWQDDFSWARNQALEHVERGWVLALDPDERLTPYGHHAIQEIIDEPRYQAYSFEMVDQTLDGVVLATIPTIIRLFPAAPAYRYVWRAHEQLYCHGELPQHATWIKGPSIVHLGYDPTIATRKGKYERNVRLIALEWQERPSAYMACKMAQEFRDLGQHDMARSWAHKVMDFEDWHRLPAYLLDDLVSMFNQEAA